MNNALVAWNGMAIVSRLVALAALAASALSSGVNRGATLSGIDQLNAMQAQLNEEIARQVPVLFKALPPQVCDLPPRARRRLP